MAKKKYVLLQGTHRQTEVIDGRKVKALYVAKNTTPPDAEYSDNNGHIVPSEHDLCKMFPLKFERYRPPVVDDDDEDDLTGEEADKTPETVVKTPTLGADVTDDFPEAGENGLLVYYSKSKPRGYTVIDTDEPGVPVNDEPVKKSKVSGIIDAYLED